MGVEVERLAGAMQALDLGGFEVALVLGSGLGAIVDRLQDARSVGFEELEGMPRNSVPGHAGRFLRGRLAQREILVQQGRVHLYEGWSTSVATRSVRAFAHLGAEVLLLTNAAGGLDPDLPVPRLLLIRDHLNRQGRTPLTPSEIGRGTPYDEGVAAVLDQAAQAIEVELVSGTYAGLMGPSYETPAEIRFLAQSGAAAVGMSTVAEALAGHASGLAVGAISVITNHAAGLSGEALSHEEVVEAGARISGDLGKLLERALPNLKLR